ncbi:hypothetical protein AVDCRST_MAG84-702 [uncultured Microcoleus sp.]|uniref:Uncharacterized protein n=1 Tax=uncultured Microcoleus sp. TaxID=259945 RepID=A0A6J4KM29_9CYAN|nr:hypothetical protein AVDCRST_MAG84-702 [uncultured Microcoleus sp.]
MCSQQVLCLELLDNRRSSSRAFRRIAKANERSGESLRQGTIRHLDDFSIAGGQDWIHLWDYFSQHK